MTGDAIGGWHQIAAPPSPVPLAGASALLCNSSYLCLVELLACATSSCGPLHSSIAHLSSGLDWNTTTDMFPTQVAAAWCYGDTRCIVILQNGQTENISVSISRPTLTVTGRGALPDSSSVDGMDCTIGPLVCFAVDGGSRVFKYDGTAWSVDATLKVAGRLTSVSCVDASDCTAIGTEGEVFHYTGRAWIPEPSLHRLGTLLSVSCARLDNGCVILTETSGLVRVGKDRKTTVVTLPADFSGATNTIGCSQRGCVIGGTRGNVVSWDGRQFYKTQPLVPSGGTISVACDPAGDCLAIDTASAAVFATDKNRW